MQSWLNVSYQWYAWLHIPSHGFPFATFLLIVPALPNLPSEPYLAFSHVYSIDGGVDTFRVSFPMLLGQLASSSVQPGGGRKEKAGAFLSPSFCLGQRLLLWLAVPPERPTLALASVLQCPVTSLPHLVPLATIFCCLAWSILSVHSKMSQFFQHLYIYVTDSLE